VTRENLHEKSRRLLADGNVYVKWATEGVIAAAVRGDSGIHDVRWTRNGGWACSCRALGGCSHQEAVRSVTMPPVSR